MLSLYAWVRSLLQSDEGQDLVEYALIIALVSIAVAVALGALAGEVQSVFDTMVQKLKGG